MNTTVFDRFYLCFGPKGLIALAYWFGCLLAEPIRDRFGSFPFLEIVGKAGAGKTTLLETLWKLFGRDDYEGLDPTKSSHVGFLLTMAESSNKPVVLNDPDYGCALVAPDSNTLEQYSWPPREQIVPLLLDRSHHSEAGREAALELGRLKARDVSGWREKVLRVEERVCTQFVKQRIPLEKILADAGVKDPWLQKNYAQIMALVMALDQVTPITPSQGSETVQRLITLAQFSESDDGFSRVPFQRRRAS